MRYCRYPGCSELVKSGYCEKHAKRSRACAYPRCPDMAIEGTSYCEKHSIAKRSDGKRGNAQSRGYDNQWAKVREAYLASHPLCERCLSVGRTTAADLVHHIRRIREGGAVYDFANLMALCTTCHEAIHKEQGDYQKHVAGSSSGFRST